MKLLLASLVLLLSPSLLRAGEAPASKGIIFATYNVHNYLGDDQTSGGQFKVKPKTDQEKEALIKVIKDIRPDILGVCEMGSAKMFEDFLTRLEQAGLGYTDFEWVDGPDPDRHVALVSRFPIVGRNSQKDVRFTLNGTEHRCKRGFLDVTIQVTPDYQLRCVGVHLKSKLPTPEGEALIRRNEAMKLHQHLEGVLRTKPATNLLCYGDFNDTKNEPMFHEVAGVKGNPGAMMDLWARDSEGDRWTHYWKTADQYSRIDYLFVSPSLWPEIQRESSTVYRSPYWFDASDHRPVYTTILPADKR